MYSSTINPLIAHRITLHIVASDDVPIMWPPPYAAAAIISHFSLHIPT